MMLEQNKHVRGFALGVVALAAVVVVARLAAAVATSVKAKPYDKSKHDKKKRASSKLRKSSSNLTVASTTTTITTASTTKSVSPSASTNASTATSPADAQSGAPLLVRDNSASFRFPASGENKSLNASKKNIAKLTTRPASPPAPAAAPEMYSAKSFHAADSQEQFPETVGTMYHAKPFYGDNNFSGASSSANQEPTTALPEFSPSAAQQSNQDITSTVSTKPINGSQPVVNYAFDRADVASLETRAALINVSGPNGQKEIPYRKPVETLVQAVASNFFSSVRIASILTTDHTKSASSVAFSSVTTATVRINEPLRSPSRKNSEACSQPKYGLDFHDVGTLATIVAINGSATFSNLSTIKVSEIIAEEHIRGRSKSPAFVSSMNGQFLQKPSSIRLPLSATTEISIAFTSRSSSPSKEITNFSEIPAQQISSVLPKSVERGNTLKPSVGTLSLAQTPVLPKVPKSATNGQQKAVEVTATAKSPEPTARELLPVAIVTDEKNSEPTARAEIHEASSERTTRVKTPETVVVNAKFLEPVVSKSVPNSPEPLASRSNTPETAKLPPIGAAPLFREKKVQESQQVITPEASLKSASQSPSTSSAQVVPRSKSPATTESTAAYRSKSPQPSAPGSVSNTSAARALSPSSVSRSKSPVTTFISSVALEKKSEDFATSTVAVVKKKSSELHVNAKEFVPRASLDSSALILSTTLRVTAQEFVPFLSTTEGSSPTGSLTSLRATATVFTPGELGDDDTYTNGEGNMSPPFLGGDPTEAYNPYASASSASSTIDGYYADYRNSMIDTNVAVWDPISGTYAYTDGYRYDGEYIHPNVEIQRAGSNEYIDSNGGVSNTSRRGSTRGGKGVRSGNGQKRQGSGTGINGNRKKSGSGSGSNGNSAPSGPTLADFIKVDKKKGVVVIADAVKAAKSQGNLTKCGKFECDDPS
ncbi:hypothetical protein HK100_000837, partial [Physocladia obscura]